MTEHQTDFELLRAFVRSADQGAFAVIVRRHLDLVYGTAYRKVSDQGATEEIAQNVFASLARKAWQFAPDDSLPAWLYKAALLESRDWLRGELRRRRREQAAVELGTTMKDPNEEAALKALTPLLDDALLSLREKERTALLLRYFESRSLREVGAALGVSEDTAQKRVASALENITSFFRRKGFKSATGALAAAALEQSATSAPIGLVAAILQSAKASGPAAGLMLFEPVLRIAALSKIQTVILCIAVAGIPAFWQWNTHRTATREQDRAMQEWQLHETRHTEVRNEIERLKARFALVENSKQEAMLASKKLHDIRQRSSDWRNRLYAALMGAEYRWRDDLPFVRVPKSVVPRVNLNLPVTPAGEVALPTRELLGLTPGERERIEEILRSHVAGMSSLAESRLYETNRYRFSMKSAVAKKIWVVPPLGEAAHTLTTSMREALRETIGEERWPIVQAQLAAGGTHTLKQILKLDADTTQREFAAWIVPEGSSYTVGFGWAGRDASVSSSGLSLDNFLPEKIETSASQAQMAIQFPENEGRRITGWLQEQAVKYAHRMPAPADSAANR